MNDGQIAMLLVAHLNKHIEAGESAGDSPAKIMDGLLGAADEFSAAHPEHDEAISPIIIKLFTLAHVLYDVVNDADAVESDTTDLLQHAGPHAASLSALGVKVPDLVLYWKAAMQ